MLSVNLYFRVIYWDMYQTGKNSMSSGKFRRRYTILTVQKLYETVFLGSGLETRLENIDNKPLIAENSTSSF